MLEHRAREKHKFMNQGFQEFLLEVPGVIWEIEVQGEQDWVVTRRYGECRPEQRLDLVGRSLSEVEPEGHGFLKAVLDGIQTRQDFSFVDGSVAGQFYQTRCRPILDSEGQVKRVVGVSINITETITSHLSTLNQATHLATLAESAIYKTVQDLTRHQDFYRNFYMVYQPIIHLEKDWHDLDAIVGVEALIRLQVEDRIIPPSQFLPALMAVGQSVSLMQWILQQVCQDTRAILESRSDFFVSINIGMDDLVNPEVNQTLKQVLINNPLFASRFHLEVLETICTQTIQAAKFAQIFYELRGLGVKIAIDDFGIQGSNFDRLALLTNGDFLKVDRVFMPKQAYGVEATLVLSMVWIGRAFQLKLVAEGVETIEQATFLKTIGCDYAQGFYFYEPLKLEELTQILQI